MANLSERLRFHGRHATETNAEAAIRKNAERDAAASILDRLTVEGLAGALDDLPLTHHAMTGTERKHVAQALLTYITGETHD